MARLLYILPVVAFITWKAYNLFYPSPPPLPDLDLNEWWGPDNDHQKQDISVRPFKISFGDDLVKDLKDRLKRTRKLTPALQGVGFEYGFNTGVIDSWLKYWADGYNFKERENFLNQFPQFKTNIQGLDIHFIKVTPKVPAEVEVVPMLLLHGWPGSVREFYESIPLLTAVSKDRDFAIELIVPSLPGYGFSDAALRPGLGAPQIAVIMKNLMSRLGYKRYYIEGGDWGAVVGNAMITLFPEEVLGYHSNTALVITKSALLWELVSSILPSSEEDDGISRIYPLLKNIRYLLQESGYSHIQSTKPDSLGVALTDSPAGLLAYFLEKFSGWTRPELISKPDGGLELKFTRDQLIDNLMIYWTSPSITTSMRLYAESFNLKTMGLRLEEIPTPVPTWIIIGKYEIANPSPSVLKAKYTNLIHVTYADDGGHFFAFELPEIFATDVLKAVTAFRNLQKKNSKTDL